MLYNYLLIALRNLRKHRLNTAVNIGGLAIGLACALFIVLFIQRERSYDVFHDNADRVYRVNYQEVARPAMRHMATIAPPMGPALRERYPEVEDFVRLRDVSNARHVIQYGDRQFYETRFFYADSSFFRLFSFRLTAGDPATALRDPGSVVLTEELAEKYFGDQNPMGRTLTMDGERELTVTGVLAAGHESSHLDFDLLISFSTFRVPFGYPVTLESWGWISFHTYVLLAPGADAAALEAKLPEFLRDHMGDETAREVRLRLQPVTDIYHGKPLHTRIASGNPSYLYGLAGIGVLMILLAGFNFANLSTAHALRRTKEAGVRKALGADQRQLMRQFLGESMLTTLLALVLALGLVQILSGAVGQLMGRTIAVGSADVVGVVLAFLCIALVVGAAAGSYPAFLLARMRPAAILKGHSGRLSGGTLRRTLVVMQFTIAITLLAGSILVGQQMAFLQEKDLGFDKEHVIVLNARGDALTERFDALSARMLQEARVVSVSRSGNLLDGGQGSQPIYPEGGDEMEPRAMPMMAVGYDFFETLGVETALGRVFDPAFPADSASGVVLNEAAARLFAATIPGWEEPIGKRFRLGNQVENGRVIGVVKDFHFASLHAEIEPLALYLPRTHLDYALVRVRSGDVSGALGALESVWQAVMPELPFSFVFLDQHLQSLYGKDLQFARLTLVFTLLTVLVACLGLFGLVACTTAVRTKEIGIRKLLGASRAGIVAMLSGQFLSHILLANLIAWPLAYLAGRHWLTAFAYRIDINLFPFFLAALLVIVVAWLTMSYGALKAASADPVNALRCE